MNSFKLLTITHKTANINHIGQYIPSVNQNKEDLATTLHQVKAAFDIDEVLYLATCNRLTFLFVTDQELTDSFIIKLFAMLHPGIPKACLGGLLNVIAKYEGIACIEHLFSVASSLDSLVVGEREILRQLRTAYEFCSQHKLTGDRIRLAMKLAIPTAKEVYTYTKIGENSVSVVSLAMRALLQKNLTQDTRFLLIGAGQTNETAAKILQQNGFTHFTIFNRSLENAQKLAKKTNGRAFALANLASFNEGFDVIVTCTGAMETIVTKEIYTALLQGDTQRKVIVDLAVPTDVHRSVVQDFEMEYIEVEKLRFLAAQNLELRKKEIGNATAIVTAKVEEFNLLLRKRKVERTITSVIPRKIKDIKARALGLVFQKEIAAMDETSRQTLEKVVNYLEKKYIGIPISVAKEALDKELFED